MLLIINNGFKNKWIPNIAHKKNNSTRYHSNEVNSKHDRVFYTNEREKIQFLKK